MPEVNISWKTRRLIKRQQIEGEHRQKLMTQLSLQYIFENPGGPRGKYAPEGWLNEQLERRGEAFRVTVTGDQWSERRP
jgi:hypothetical protein